KKIALQIPRIGRLDLDLSIGIEGYLEAGVEPVWVSGTIDFPDDYAFDPMRPEIPDFELKDAKAIGGLKGAGGVRSTLSLAAGTPAVLRVVAEAKTMIEATISGDLAAAGRVVYRGGKLGGGLGVDASAAMDFAADFFVDM